MNRAGPKRYYLFVFPEDRLGGWLCDGNDHRGAAMLARNAETTTHDAIGANERMTITEFLEARIAEDEAAARASTGGPWRVETSPFDIPAIWGADNIGGFGKNNAATDNQPDAEHIVRHDPARVLAECAAKRALIRWVNRRPMRPAPPSSVDGVLETLAAVYADHPDYDPAWAV